MGVTGRSLFSHLPLLQGVSDELVPLEQLNWNAMMSQTVNRQSAVRLSVQSEFSKGSGFGLL